MIGPTSSRRSLRAIITLAATLAILLTPSATWQPDPLTVAPLAQTKGPRAQVELSLETSLPVAPPRLMTYRVNYPTIDQAYLNHLAHKLGVESPMGHSDNSIMGSMGELGLEVYVETGAFWYRDGARLWSEDAPKAPLDPAQGQRLAQALLDSWELLPTGAAYEGVGWSERTIYDAASGASATERMDLHINYRMTVGGKPVVGPGGKIKVYLGDGYRVAGLYWAGFKAQEHRALPILPAETALHLLADEGIATTVKGARSASVTQVDLVYYAGPGTVAQAYLEPIYRFRGSVAGPEETRGFTQYVPALQPSYRRESPIARDLPAIEDNSPSLFERWSGQ
jgi:hypothetical protein